MDQIGSSTIASRLSAFGFVLMIWHPGLSSDREYKLHLYPLLIVIDEL